MAAASSFQQALKINATIIWHLMEFIMELTFSGYGITADNICQVYLERTKILVKFKFWRKEQKWAQQLSIKN